MTTTQTDPYAEAHQTLDALDTLTAAGLAQPFIDWVDQLTDVHFNVEAVLVPMNNNPAVYERALRLRAMLSEAGEIVEAAAMNGIHQDGTHTATGIRPFFDHMTSALELRCELALFTHPPTEETSARYSEILKAKAEASASERARIESIKASSGHSR